MVSDIWANSQKHLFVCVNVAHKLLLRERTYFTTGFRALLWPGSVNLTTIESRKQCIFLKQYGMSVYFEEVSKKLNLCFEDLVKIVCLPEILNKDSVFGYSSKYKIKL